MSIPFWVWLPLAYLGSGIALTCLLQTTCNGAVPPSYNYNRYDPWKDWERGLTCLFWPVCAVFWSIYLIGWLLSSGLGKIVGLICPGNERR